MHILGITGPIGHGKSALITAMQQAEPSSVHAESSDIIIQVADMLNKELHALPNLIVGYTDPQSCQTWLDIALPRAIRHISSVSFDINKLIIGDAGTDPALFATLDLYMRTVRQQPLLLERPITSETKELYRPFLQWIGGYVTTRLGCSLWYEELIARSRVSEASGCQLYIIGGVRFLADATVLRRACGAILSIERSGVKVQDIIDPTEDQRSQILTDSTIYNDAGLAELQRLGETIATDIRAATLRQSYRASSVSVDEGL